jgi:sugar lactone lactonase YvrE
VRTIARHHTIVDGLAFPESLVWHDDGLWFVDLHTHAVHHHRGGTTAVVATVPGTPSGIGFLPDGRMLAGLRWDRQLLAGRTGRFEPFADLSDLGAASVGNVAPRQDGRVYVSLRAERGYSPEELVLRDGEQGDGDWIALVDPAGPGAAVVASGLIGPYNFSLSPDETTLVVDEARGQRLSAFNVEPDGTLSGRRVYVSLEGRPIGGLSVDAQGAVWVGSSMHHEFLRIEPGGEVTDRIGLDGTLWAVGCEHGGPDGRTLFLVVVDTTLENQGLVASRRDDSLSIAKGRVEVARVDVPGVGW